MRFIKKILFIFVLLASLSAVSMAQKGDDQKKPPPKNPPPVINPGKGNQNPPPKGDNKPKKPNGGVAVILWRRENGPGVV